jgi:hypothetical protein
MAAIDEITRVADERAARLALRRQIAQLDRRLAILVASACPRLAPAPGPRTSGGPRLLDLGELERIRDGLAAQVTDLEARTGAQQARQAEARRALEAMRADPPAHRRLRLSNADLGFPGCTTYQVGPRAGVLGRLLGWWEVKVSGGCPLPA